MCRLALLDVERHAADLWAANSLDREGRMWTYLPWGPFGGFDEYLAYLQTVAPKDDPLIHAIIDIGRMCSLLVSSVAVVPSSER